MTHPSRPFAMLAALSVVAGTLLAISGATVANASTATSIATIKTALDHTRADNGKPDYLTNGFVSAYAQEKAVAYSKCGPNCVAAAPTADALPTPMTPSSSTWSALHPVTGSGAATKMGAFFSEDYTSAIDGPDNYIGIGYVVKGSKTYAYVVGVEYSSPPLERITPGTVTLPSTVNVGKTIVPKLSGFPSSGVAYGYVWQRNGTDVGFGTTYTPNATDRADLGTIKVLLQATETGYLTYNTTSNTTHKVGIGTLVGSTKIAELGEPYVDQTLTAAIPAPWTAGTVFTEQWLRNGHAVGGATGPTYLLGTADKGKKIDVVATATQVGYTTRTFRTHTTHTVGAPLIPDPQTPEIFSVGEFGDNAGIVFVDPWGPAPVTLHYQWRISGKAIPHATKSIYTIGASAIGHNLTVSVTGSKSGYSSVTTTSAPIVPTALPFLSVPTIVVTGTYSVGHTLSAAHGTWVPSATSYQYQWFRDNSPITHATKSTYKIVSADVAHLIILRVTGIKSGYHSTYAYGPLTNTAS